MNKTDTSEKGLETLIMRHLPGVAEPAPATGGTGFTLDVLKHYTPVASYYRLAKTVAGDPEYDVKKACKKLRVYVESHSKAICDKAEIMLGPLAAYAVTLATSYLCRRIA